MSPAQRVSSGLLVCHIIISQFRLSIGSDTKWILYSSFGLSMAMKVNQVSFNIILILLAMQFGTLHESIGLE